MNTVVTVTEKRAPWLQIVGLGSNGELFYNKSVGSCLLCFWIMISIRLMSSSLFKL